MSDLSEISYLRFKASVVFLLRLHLELCPAPVDVVPPVDVTFGVVILDWGAEDGRRSAFIPPVKAFRERLREKESVANFTYCWKSLCLQSDQVVAECEISFLLLPETARGVWGENSSRKQRGGNFKVEQLWGQNLLRIINDLYVIVYKVSNLATLSCMSV